jgi:hypothetical protein
MASMTSIFAFEEISDGSDASCVGTDALALHV